MSSASSSNARKPDLILGEHVNWTTKLSSPLPAARSSEPTNLTTREFPSANGSKYAVATSTKTGSSQVNNPNSSKLIARMERANGMAGNNPYALIKSTPAVVNNLGGLTSIVGAFTETVSRRKSAESKLWFAVMKARN